MQKPPRGGCRLRRVRRWFGLMPEDNAETKRPGSFRPGRLPVIPLACDHAGMPPPFPIAELDYELPQELIAQQPARHRDASRLLVVQREPDEVFDRTFGDLPAFLRAGDLLVVNDTRVVPARFYARRATGGRLDGLYLREIRPGEWEVLLNGAGRLRPGEWLTLEPEGCEVRLYPEERLERGRWRARVSPPQDAERILGRIGRTPLPPYIRRSAEGSAEQAAEDHDRYQTVYAARAGAVAAPTAGLHFSDDLLARLRGMGVEMTCVTLHVGLATFAPLRVDDLAEHEMHAEWYELTPGVAAAVQRCRERGGRVVAVGTTSVRVLESCARNDGTVEDGQGWTELFCYPPYRFRVVDALVTNFHLPRSTLLALVMAFAGVALTRRAYQHAVHAAYRFYSYGDAMLIV